MRVIPSIALAALLCSCATRLSIGETLSQWVGYSEQELVTKWGYPQRTFQNAAGNTVYEYNSSQSAVMMVPAGVNTMAMPISRSCTVWIEIENGYVKTGSYRGNGC